jgi:hypothetical protein
MPPVTRSSFDSLVISNRLLPLRPKSALALLPPGDYRKGVRQIGERADTHSLDKILVVFFAESALTKNNAVHPIESKYAPFFWNSSVRPQGANNNFVSAKSRNNRIATKGSLIWTTDRQPGEWTKEKHPVKVCRVR